jgi:hypothetical protein
MIEDSITVGVLVVDQDVNSPLSMCFQMTQLILKPFNDSGVTFFEISQMIRSYFLTHLHFNDHTDGEAFARRDWCLQRITGDMRNCWAEKIPYNHQNLVRKGLIRIRYSGRQNIQSCRILDALKDLQWSGKKLVNSALLQPERFSIDEKTLRLPTTAKQWQFMAKADGLAVDIRHSWVRINVVSQLKICQDSHWALEVSVKRIVSTQRKIWSWIIDQRYWSSSHNMQSGFTIKNLQ